MNPDSSSLSETGKFFVNMWKFCKLCNIYTVSVRPSGLRLNGEKTEAYWLGILHDSPEHIGSNQWKVLTFFMYNWQKFQALNFEYIIILCPFKKLIFQCTAVEDLNAHYYKSNYQDLQNPPNSCAMHH